MQALPKTQILQRKGYLPSLEETCQQAEVIIKHNYIILDGLDGLLLVSLLAPSPVNFRAEAEWAPSSPVRWSTQLGVEHSGSS